MPTSHADTINLDTLLMRSTHIVVALASNPHYLTELVEIEKDGITYPPYRRQVFQYQVMESLQGELKKGSLINVVAASDGQDEYLHRLYVTENTSKSTHQPRYQPQALPDSTKPGILFLSKQGDSKHFNFVSGNSTEGITMLAKIKYLLKKGSDLDTFDFEFGSVHLTQKNAAITLTINEKWTDAQTSPPPDFNLNIQPIPFTKEDFFDVLQLLQKIDFTLYAKLSDADFVSTPPDMQHTEHLSYTSNGHKIVQWVQNYKILKPALRLPLAELETHIIKRWSQQILNKPKK